MVPAADSCLSDKALRKTHEHARPSNDDQKFLISATLGFIAMQPMKSHFMETKNRKQGLRNLLEQNLEL